VLAPCGFGKSGVRRKIGHYSEEATNSIGPLSLWERVRVRAADNADLTSIHEII
jgi:hypothetical protein